jgi:hypothetical protein
MIEFLLGGLIVAGAIGIGLALGNIIANKSFRVSNNSNNYSPYVSSSSSYANTYPTTSSRPISNPNFSSLGIPIQLTQPNHTNQTQQDADRALLY